ncbi:ATP-grasp domain-containing protein [Halovivax cerinus]|uniref:ATP-grasp domain-containing protein n=1 Tax=Halovivax cerinus TaxID=1487865 RepID=A0ABD5NMK5_9EURY|nr:ATP-grasp domain-containing protein [Halovivax cerinus]
MARVLVTGVGGVGGASTARWFRDRTGHTPVGVDMDPRARGFLDLAEWTTVPPAADDDWPGTVASVVARRDVDVVVPLVDEELTRHSDLRAALPSAVPIVAPTVSTIERTLDKRRFARWIDGTDLPAPRTVCPTSSTDLSALDVAYPAVVKPRLGHGSRGVSRVASLDDLRTSLAYHDFDPADVVVQEAIEGREFTTSVVATTGGDCLSIVTKEAVEKDGNTTWGVTRSNDAVASACRDLHDRLDPRGPINVQQLVDARTGEAYIVEVNPRFSSTAILTARAGVDELDLLVRDALDESISPPPSPRPGVHLIRTNRDHLVQEECTTPSESTGWVANSDATPADLVDGGRRAPSSSDADTA